ncbi:MAG: hypothetical protein AAF721_31130 [Myxococcota bacterium]
MLFARTLGFTAGLLAAAISCGEPAAFSCVEDSECVLSGVEGQCQATGSCAYPDDACVSGWSYPAGAPAELAGRCIDAAGTEDGLTSSGGESTTTSGGTASTGLAVDGTTASPTDGTTTGFVTSTGGAVDSSGGGSSSGGTGSSEVGSSSGGACVGDDHPDLVSDAKIVGDCSQTEIDGVIHDVDDLDFFGIGTCNLPHAVVTSMGSDDVEICVVVACTLDVIPDVECGPEAQAWSLADEVFTGCCGTGMYEADLNCSGGGDFWAVARSTGDGTMCSDYAAGVQLQPGIPPPDE